MSDQVANKRIASRWFTEFWGKNCDLQVVDQLAEPDMLFEYSLHTPHRGRQDIKAFMTRLREAFPDFGFWRTEDLLAEGDFVIVRWEGGGMHTGPAYDDFRIGLLPAATGRRMHFSGTTVLRIKDDKIAEENGLADGVTVLKQLGLIHLVWSTGLAILAG
jgi:predicted ester cyclase